MPSRDERERPLVEPLSSSGIRDRHFRSGIRPSAAPWRGAFPEPRSESCGTAGPRFARAPGVGNRHLVIAQPARDRAQDDLRRDQIPVGQSPAQDLVDSGPVEQPESAVGVADLRKAEITPQKPVVSPRERLPVPLIAPFDLSADDQIVLAPQSVKLPEFLWIVLSSRVGRKTRRGCESRGRPRGNARL